MKPPRLPKVQARQLPAPHTLRLAGLFLPVLLGEETFCKGKVWFSLHLPFLLPLRTPFTHGRDRAKAPTFLLEKCEELGSHIAFVCLYIMAQEGVVLLFR